MKRPLILPVARVGVMNFPWTAKCVTVPVLTVVEPLKRPFFTCSAGNRSCSPLVGTPQKDAGLKLLDRLMTELPPAETLKLIASGPARPE